MPPDVVISGQGPRAVGIAKIMLIIVPLEQFLRGGDVVLLAQHDLLVYGHLLRVHVTTSHREFG